MLTGTRTIGSETYPESQGTSNRGFDRSKNTESYAESQGTSNFAFNHFKNSNIGPSQSFNKSKNSNLTEDPSGSRSKYFNKSEIKKAETDRRTSKAKKSFGAQVSFVDSDSSSSVPERVDESVSPVPERVDESIPSITERVDESVSPAPVKAVANFQVSLTSDESQSANNFFSNQVKI